MLAAHKTSWILQAIKRFGHFYYRKYNNGDVVQLIRDKLLVWDRFVGCWKKGYQRMPPVGKKKDNTSDT